MNKELDKNRVMSNRPPRNSSTTFIQRTTSVSPWAAGPQTPGAALVPISRVRHARWNRQMASMWMTAGNVDTGRFHSLRALHILGAPLPVAEEADHHSACLCCPCAAALLLIGRQGKAGAHPASPRNGSVSDLAGTTAWTDRPSRASQSDIGSLPSVSSDLRNEFKDHSNEERQEAAAVLMLLVNAELQIEPPDPEAFRYILQTCCYFEVRQLCPACDGITSCTAQAWKQHTSLEPSRPNSGCSITCSQTTCHTTVGCNVCTCSLHLMFFICKLQLQCHSKAAKHICVAGP